MLSSCLLCLLPSALLPDREAAVARRLYSLPSYSDATGESCAFHGWGAGSMRVRCDTGPDWPTHVGAWTEEADGERLRRTRFGAADTKSEAVS